MEPLAIVAFLVTCSPNLLHCDTLDTAQLEWKDPERCAQDVTRLIRHYESAGHSNVMGKCRIVLPDDARRPRIG